jgi:hypothetical protein
MSEFINLCVSANGKRVLYDPVSSHAATNFADTPDLKKLTSEILAGTKISDKKLLFDMDLGRTIGNTDLVENDENDAIVFAKRKNRNAYTSFNKSKGPQPSSLVSIGLKKIDDYSYLLESAWIGSVASPPFPGEPDETPDSIPYWLSHSLAYGTQAIQPRTETDVCPWL